MKHERPRIELSGQPLSFAEMVRVGSGKVAISASATGMARVPTRSENCPLLVDTTMTQA